MMQSVALTESCLVRDDDFVVVEMPRSMNRHLGSIFDIVGDGIDDDDDGTSEGGKLDDDDDDASYDYCDDFTINDKLIPNTGIQATSHLISTSLTMDVNLSFVVNDDDISSSVCPPSLSEDDNNCLKQEVFSDNMSDLSSSIQDGSSDVEVPVDPPTERVAVGIITDETIDSEPQPQVEILDLVPASVDEKDEQIPKDSDDTNGNVHDSSEKESTDSPKENNPVMESEEVTLTTTESKAEKGEKLSRLSNKKRRKQLKLAKKAAAVATAVSKLSASSKPKTRRSGKQVAPIESIAPLTSSASQ